MIFKVLFRHNMLKNEYILIYISIKATCCVKYGNKKIYKVNEDHFKNHCWQCRILYIVLISGSTKMYTQKQIKDRNLN